MTRISLGLIGLGTVGQGLVKLISSRRDSIRVQFGVDIQVKALCDLRPVPALLKAVPAARFTKDFKSILSDPGIDVVVELIGGLHPAFEIIRGALSSGKNVVTANKAVISHHGKELFALAQKTSKSVYFESAVLAGVPIIKTLVEGVAGNRYNAIYGIVNGTCNYILSEMQTSKMSFEDAVRLAQKKGYAESDPTLDISGGDSAHKLAILVSLAMGKTLKVKDIHAEGITQISQEDLVYAEEMGLSVKLLGIAKKKGDGVEARVSDPYFPSTSLGRSEWCLQRGPDGG